MFHEAEEAHRKGKPWEVFLKKYRTKLLANYPDQEAEIYKWASICQKQYPLYLRHWEQHEDETSRKPLLAEASFKVPYLLPSGRTVILRGKFDAVTLLPISSPKKAAPRGQANKNHRNKKGQTETPELGIFLQENKTKGQIDEEGILGTVSQNLQTMLYQIALRAVCTRKVGDDNGQYVILGGQPKQRDSLLSLVINHPVAGTLYNVIRRPLADRFAIKQREGRLDKKTNRRIGAETASQFYERVAQQIRDASDDPAKPQYFMRWKVLLDDQDIERFKTRVFNPILEQLCDWWEWISVDPFDPWRPRLASDYAEPGDDRELLDKCCKILTINPHFQTPWGIYNSMFGGFRGDYFNLLTADRQYGLTKITTVFPELS